MSRIRGQRSGYEEYGRKPLGSGYSGSKRPGTQDWSREPPRERFGRAVNPVSKPILWSFPRATPPERLNYEGTLGLSGGDRDEDGFETSDILVMEFENPNEGLSRYLCPYIGTTFFPVFDSDEYGELVVWPIYYRPQETPGSTPVYLQQPIEESTHEQIKWTSTNYNIPEIYADNSLTDVGEEVQAGVWAFATFPDADDYQPISEHCMVGSFYKGSYFHTQVGWGCQFNSSVSGCSATIDLASITWFIDTGGDQAYTPFYYRNNHAQNPFGLTTYADRYPDPVT